MIKSPAEGVLKDTLQRIADAILDGTGADISVVCLRSEDGTYRIEAYAGDFPVALKDDLDFKAGQGSAGECPPATAPPAPSLGRSAHCDADSHSHQPSSHRRSPAPPAPA